MCDILSCEAKSPIILSISSLCMLERTSSTSERRRGVWSKVRDDRPTPRRLRCYDQPDLNRGLCQPTGAAGCACAWLSQTAVSLPVVAGRAGWRRGARGGGTSPRRGSRPRPAAGSPSPPTRRRATGSRPPTSSRTWASASKCECLKQVTFSTHEI